MQKSKKLILSIVAVIALGLIMFGIWNVSRPKPAAGAKEVTVEVMNSEGDITKYTVRTDAEYLSEVMEELTKSTDFTYTGSTSEYGLFLESVNGETADYSKDQSYWAIYVNDEYGMYGADQQPVVSGDVYRLAYEH